MRIRLLALAAYAVLVGSLLTPLFSPAPPGVGGSWPVAVLLGAAHLGLGAAVARAWALVAPTVFAVLLWADQGAQGLANLILVLGLPILWAATLLAVTLGSVDRRRALLAASACFLLAAAPLAWASLRSATRNPGPHVPAAVQAALPTEFGGESLCQAGETTRGSEALLRALQSRPHDLVWVTIFLADEPPGRRELTVRELAQEHLRQLPDDRECLGLRRRLEEGLR